MRYRYLITGASGLLGSTLLNDVAALNGHARILERRDLIVSLDFDCLKAKIKESKCDVLIHCAANTNVEQCETDIEGCYRVNYLLPELLAGICESLKIKLVFISSTGIYGNVKDSPYTELDHPNPTTVHHAAKYEAEKQCQLLCPNTLIIRTGWLFGGNINKRKNFVVNRVNEANLSSGVIYSDPFQKGNPSYVLDVSQRILELTECDQRGIYNCVNSGVTSRYEYVKKIVETSITQASVQKLQAPFKRVAKVSNNESAINFKMDLLGYPRMRDWKDALEEYIREKKL